MEMLARVGSEVKETFFFLITWEKFQHVYNADGYFKVRGKLMMQECRLCFNAQEKWDSVEDLASHHLDDRRKGRVNRPR